MESFLSAPQIIVLNSTGQHSKNRGDTNYHSKILDGSDIELTEIEIEKELLEKNEEQEKDTDVFFALWRELEESLKDDSVALEVLVIYRVLASEHDFVSNKSVASELSMPIEDVRNTLKRIRAKAEKILRKKNEQ